VFHQVGGRVSHTLTQSLGYHGGYSWGPAGVVSAQNTTTFHNVDVGIDFRKAFSVSRRTTFSFSTGSTAARRGAATSVPGSGRTEFHLLADANLNHNIGRTWHASIAYSRGWQILDGALQASLNDAISAGVSGRLGQRVAIGTNGSFLLGQTQTATTHNRAYAVRTFLNFTLSRVLSGFAQYTYYRQQFDLSQTGLTLPFDISRNGVRAGVTLSLRSR
jgi:hypothetical protein